MSLQDLWIVTVSWIAVALLALAAALGGVTPAPAFSWGGLTLLELAGTVLLGGAFRTAALAGTPAR